MSARSLLDFAERACARVALPMLERRAIDISGPCAQRSALVLAPHPDDETLGCGAAILRKIDAGSHVTVVLATDGRHSHHSGRLSAEKLVEMRTAEFREACVRLGLQSTDVISWGFEDGTLGANKDELTARIRSVIDERGPQELLIPSDIDGHADHRDLHAAAVRAAREAEFAGAILAYPVWFWTIKADLHGRRPTVINIVRALWAGVRTLATIKTMSVDAAGVLGRKRHAIDAYESQLRTPADEPGWATIPEHVLRRFTRDKELYFPVGDHG